MEEWGKPGDDESGGLGGGGAAGSTSGSKYCIWVRSPNWTADCEWGPLEEVGGGFLLSMKYLINSKSLGL